MVTTNRYCEKLGIPAPRLSELLPRRKFNLLEAMVAALLERGAPMGLEEIASRLEAEGVRGRSGKLSASLRRAWGGREPVYPDSEGRCGLDLHHRRLEEFLEKAGLRPGDPPAPPSDWPPDDSLPLDSMEITIALRARRETGLDGPRLVAAVLDTSPEPLAPGKVEQMLSELLCRPFRLADGSIPAGRRGLVTQTEDGRLSLDREHPDLRPLRTEIRLRGGDGLRVWTEARIRWEYKEEVERRKVARKKRRELEAALLRRGVLHCLPDPRRPGVFGLLDISDHEILTGPLGETEALAERLGALDVVVGLEVRATVAALGLDPNDFILRDLRPPRKTMRREPGGRIVKVTPARLVRDTTGIEVPLTDPGDAAADGPERLRHRVEFDLEALYALYRYGALHRFVALRLGSRRKLLSVDWAEPGDLTLHGIIQAAVGGREVDVIVGDAPDWRDPWAGALRTRVGMYEGVTPVIVDPKTGEPLRNLSLVQAMRLV